MKISKDVKRELDIRIKNLEERKTELYTWDEVKNHLKTVRENTKFFVKRSVI